MRLLWVDILISKKKSKFQQPKYFKKDTSIYVLIRNVTSLPHTVLKIN